MGLVHFKTQKQCFKIETQLENSTCFIQSSSYSRDSIIYKNDKEVNSPESESREGTPDGRFKRGLLIGGLAAGMLSSINGEDWAPLKLVPQFPQLLQRLLQHVLFLKQHGDRKCVVVLYLLAISGFSCIDILHVDFCE